MGLNERGDWGWDQATATLVALVGTTKAAILLAVTSLNTTIYVDDVVFQQAQ